MCLQQQMIADGDIFGILHAWALCTIGWDVDCRLHPASVRHYRLPGAPRKALASPAFMLEKLKTKTSDPAAPSASAAAAAGPFTWFRRFWCGHPRRSWRRHISLRPPGWGSRWQSRRSTSPRTLRGWIQWPSIVEGRRCRLECSELKRGWQNICKIVYIWKVLGSPETPCPDGKESLPPAPPHTSCLPGRSCRPPCFHLRARWNGRSSAWWPPARSGKCSPQNCSIAVKRTHH